MTIREIHNALDAGLSVVCDRFEAEVVRRGEALFLEAPDFRLPLVHPRWGTLVVSGDLFRAQRPLGWGRDNTPDLTEPLSDRELNGRWA